MGGAGRRQVSEAPAERLMLLISDPCQKSFRLQRFFTRFSIIIPALALDSIEVPAARGRTLSS